MCGSELHALKKITAVIDMPYHGFDQHSGAYMLRANPALIDPFIGIDSYTMPQPFFGPHPHAGMSAVSLMLPEADGGFLNRDSLGDHSLIRPGDLHWTQAGRGMMHEEVPAEPGKAARGMQIFVNLSRAHKQAEPAALRVNHEDMPVVNFEGGHLRVVAGEFQGQSSCISSDPRWLTRVNMLDVTLEPGASVDIPVKAGDNAFFVIRSGTFLNHFEALAGKDIAQSAIIFEANDALMQVARLQAGGEKLRGVFFSGTPINEPIYPGGPFMGNSAEDIVAYKRAFAAGQMGHLSKSF
ncbi:MAG: pirin family protein [Brachymonas sp.]|nr:pirin family protein [Brachymonas sp.]